MEKLSLLKLVPWQQKTLDTDIQLDQFLLDKSTQQDQVFIYLRKMDVMGSFFGSRHSIVSHTCQLRQLSLFFSLRSLN